MHKHLIVGKIGELIAQNKLKSSGYRIIETNFLRTWGEIDIIAHARDRTLVFIEVKTMLSGGPFEPEENVTSAKLKKVRRTAMLYVCSRYDLVNDKRGWRIDVIAVTLDRDAIPIDIKNKTRQELTNFLKRFNRYTLRHWENV